MHVFILAVVAATLLSVPPALARTVIEEMIAAENPCSGLKVELGFITIGIDKLKDVRLDEATISLTGDDFMVSLVGWLACEASSAGGFEADAAAQISASGQASLTACESAEVDVSLDQFGGSHGEVLEALAPLIEASLRDEMRTELQAACLRFRGGG